jgi:hypothetical protein
MEWNYLGHAGWLCVADGLRILFDPLLDRTHHGGVFEVVPRRTVHAHALRPDFLVISHAHADHFDVPSLRRLARMDPRTVVITSDPLVEHAARRVGFHTVHRAAPRERIDLDGVRLVTTASYADAVEWGMLVEHRSLVTWNQVDTVHRTPFDVRSTLDAAAAGLSLPSLSDRVDLLLARWQPLCEIAPLLGERAAFDHRAYGRLLDELAAARPVTVVPASAGGRHVAPFDWLNAFSHPVPMERFLDDIRRRIPGVNAHPARPGDRYVLTADGALHEPAGASALVHVESPETVTPPPDEWRPVAIPPVSDHNPWGYPLDHARAVTARWIHDQLAPALSKNAPHFQTNRPLAFVLELVFDGATDAYTVTVTPEGHTTIQTRADPRGDALNVLSGSQLCAVIEGRACWGDVLLSGGLRAFERAYAVDGDGLRRARVGVTFVYYALPYEESFRRFIAHELDRG